VGIEKQNKTIAFFSIKLQSHFLDLLQKPKTVVVGGFASLSPDDCIDRCKVTLEGPRLLNVLLGLLGPNYFCCLAWCFSGVACLTFPALAPLYSQQTKRSSEYFKVFLTYPSRASTVLAY
jgi:hypothetical protein